MLKKLIMINIRKFVWRYGALYDAPANERLDMAKRVAEFIYSGEILPENKKQS